MKVQIDVIAENVNDSGFVKCNLYTGDRCVMMLIRGSDYYDLIRDGFFIRDGKELDSANVLNTTDVYKIIP